MSLLRRVVFDTSSLVSAALKHASVPHQALLHALALSDVCGPMLRIETRVVRSEERRVGKEC